MIRGLAIALAAGAASAQPAATPAPKAGPPAPAPPLVVQPPPVAAPSEAPPPIDVPTPAPVAVPPILQTEVEPAPAPAEKVDPKPTAPARRVRYEVAVLQVLDKVTAETLRFEAPVGKPIRYKTLVFTVKACEHSAPTEPVSDWIAYLTVDSQPRPQPGKPAPAARQAFKGWMFASSPGLNPLQHPVYDAWVINCRAALPANAPGA